MQDFAGHDVDCFRLVRADPEPQAAFEDVGDLFVLVRMTRNDRALLEVNVREHDAIGGYQAPVKHFTHLLLRHVVPAIERDASFAHSFLPWSSIRSGRW